MLVLLAAFFVGGEQTVLGNMVAAAAALFELDVSQGPGTHPTAALPEHS